MKSQRPLITIFLIVFIDLLGFGIILPLLPFIGERYGANAFIIGLLSATYSLFQLIASPILGRLSDRYGRKKLLIISQIGTFFGFILLGVAHSLPLLFLSRIIDGATGGNISIAQAYISDSTDKTNRAKAMGMIGAAFGLGFIFGPALGGILSRFGYAVPAFTAAGISFITILCTIFFLKESVNITQAKVSPRTRFTINEFKHVLCCSPIRLFLVVFFILNFSFSLMQGNISLWTERAFKFGPTENGFLFMYIGILAVIIQLQILPRLLKSWGEKKIFVNSIFVLGIGLLSLMCVIHPYLLIIPFTLMPIGNGLSGPVIQSLTSENVIKEEYGETLGLLQSAGSLGRIIGPIMGGFLFSTFNKDIPFLISGTLVLGVYFYLKRNYK